MPVPTISGGSIADSFEHNLP